MALVRRNLLAVLWPRRFDLKVRITCRGTVILVLEVQGIESFVWWVILSYQVYTCTWLSYMAKILYSLPVTIENVPGAKKTGVQENTIPQFFNNPNRQNCPNPTRAAHETRSWMHTPKELLADSELAPSASVIRIDENGELEAPRLQDTVCE